MRRFVYVVAVALAVVAASCAEGLAPPEPEARTTIYATEAFFSRAAAEAFGPEAVGDWVWSQGGGGCRGFEQGERELVSTMDLNGRFFWPTSRDEFEAVVVAAGGEMTGSTDFAMFGNGASFGAPRGLGKGLYEFKAGLGVELDRSASLEFTFGCFPFGSSANP